MTPNPGSDEAVAAGCTCPVMDNARGRGIPIATDEGELQIAYWINGNCPIHGNKVSKDTKEGE
jgi:hypothetical protein